MDIVFEACVCVTSRDTKRTFRRFVHFFKYIFWAILERNHICDISKIMLSQNWLFLVVYFLTVFYVR
jgi:hypothetical protein